MCVTQISRNESAFFKQPSAKFDQNLERKKIERHKKYAKALLKKDTKIFLLGTVSQTKDAPAQSSSSSRKEGTTSETGDDDDEEKEERFFYARNGGWVDVLSSSSSFRVSGVFFFFFL